MADNAKKDISKNNTPKGKERESRFELLRIISQLAIIMGHFRDNTSCMEAPFLPARAASVILGSGYRIAVNVFLFISLYFITDTDVKPSKAVKLWFDALIYLVPIGTVSFILSRSVGVNIGLIDYLRGFFPLFGYPVWYVSAYMLLLVFAPALRKVCLMIPEKTRAPLAVLLLLYISGTSTVFLWTGQLVNILWFAAAYFIMFCIKRRTPALLKNKAFCLIGAAVIYFGITGAWALAECKDIIIGGRNLSPLIKRFGYHWTYDIKCLPCFLCALFIFYFFVNMKPIGCRRGINKIASLTPGVYIMHAIPAFFPLYWEFFDRAEYYGSYIFIPYMITVSAGVFTVCAVTEALKQRFIDPLVLRSELYKKACAKVGETFSI